MAEDLPALLRPTKHTSGAPGAGNWSRRAAEVTNEALCRIVKMDQTIKGSCYCIIDAFAVGEIDSRSLNETSVNAQHTS
jgi:hypothetical protein